ncbi:MAG: hypothetical protein ABJF50_22605 [Paracoccaceae bacterium]
MSLNAMLDTHDASALSALASVGLVRRATRDLEAGKAEVKARDEISASVTADGQEVQLDAAGPSAAQCGCPATGICRHIILAILALRDSGEGASQDEPTPAPNARDDILALTEGDIRKFAGADWDKAVRQALISTEATIAEDGPNTSVQLPDTDHPVVVLAGLGLKGAVYKGAKTTKRRVVTTAALILRAQAGTAALDALETDAPDVESLSVETVTAAREAIMALVTGVLGGGSAIAEDQIFDLSISARAQAAPRLTALLRLLTRHARAARTNHFSYDDARFLSDAALACALTHALEVNPSSPDLTGVIRRHYGERDTLDIRVLSAVKWTAGSGARGTRIHAVDPETGTWYSTGQARAAGMDPSFSPRSVYNAPLWGLDLVEGLIGEHLHLQHPQVSTDNQISWEGAHAKKIAARPIVEELAEAGLLHSLWSAAHADVANRLPSGLQWDGRAIPLLIQPKSLGDARFDDIAQTYHLTARDGLGTGLPLKLSADRVEDVEWLSNNSARIAMLLCEVTQADNALSVTPVTAYLRNSGSERSCINLTLDPPHVRNTGGVAAVGGRIAAFLKTAVVGSGPDPQESDPIRALALSSFDAIAEKLRFGTAPALPKLAERAETIGFGSLSKALAQTEATGTPEDGLRASYIASQILQRAF